MKLLRIGQNQAAAIGAAALLTVGAAGPAAAQIGVDVNGRAVSFTDAQPMQMNGRVFIPLRNVAESLGATVRWDAATKTVYGSRDGRSFTLPIGARTAFVQGESMALDVPAQIVYGQTMVPLRFVGEALGAEVAWHPADRRVAVSLAGANVAANPVVTPDADADRERERQERRERRERRERIRDRGPDSAVAGDRLERITVPVDTIIQARLEDDLSSRTAREGDRFTATLSTDDRSRFPIGTKFEGRITDVRRAEKDEPGVIDVAFERAILPDGTDVAISGGLASLEQDQVVRGEDGRLTASRKADAKKFDWKWVGIGAGGGAVLGTVLGGATFRGALLGGLGGAIYSYLNKGKGSRDYRDVELSSGTQFGIRLNERVAFSERDSYRYE